MAQTKKISTEFQLLDKFLDTSGSAGSSGSVLTSTSTGTSWVSAGIPGTGVYLPLAGGTMTGTIVGPTAGSSSANPPALEVVASGTANEQASIAIQQKTSEGDTIIFADYDPYVEYGISTENGSNLIQITGGGSSANSVGSKTLYNNLGNPRTAYTRFQVSLSSGQTLIGGNVGIGLTNPADRLDLYDSDDNVGMYFHTATSGTGGGNGLRVGQNNANAFVWNYEATPMSLATSGTARLTINATGGIRFNTGYGAGTLVTDASGNITVSSGGGAGGPYLPVANPTFTGTLTGPNATFTGQLQGNDATFGGEIIVNNNFVNYKFTALDNVSVQYWLLCFNGGANDVNGTLIGDRSSGHHQAMNLDIVVSAKSASMQTGMLTTKQVLEANEKYTLVTLTYNSNNYIAIKYDGHPYPITGNGYFTGLLKSTIGSNFLLAVNGASVSNVAAFSNANTKATIQANKVGINTPDPAYNFEVNGYAKVGTFGINAAPDAYLTSLGARLTVGGNIVINTSSPLLYLRANGTSNISDIRYQNSLKLTNGSGSTHLTISNGGKVGIGITSNTTIPLHVNTTSSSTVIKAQGIAATIEIESGTAGNATLYQRPNTTGDKEAEFRCTLGSTYGWSWKDDNATSTSRIKYMKLDQNPGTLTVKGDVVAYGSPSDRSLKENIKPIDSALDKVMKLQGVTFDWKPKEDVILDIKEDIGFIAQDVQKVVPELIRKNSNGLLSMRHQGVTPILLEAIKELKAEIDLLKSKPCTCNKCNCNI